MRKSEKKLLAYAQMFSQTVVFDWRLIHTQQLASTRKFTTYTAATSIPPTWRR